MTLDLHELRARLGGYVSDGGRRWRGPGPGHSRHDDSLTVWLEEDGRVAIASFSGDSFQACARHVGLSRGRVAPEVASRPLRPVQDTAGTPEEWTRARLDRRPTVEAYLRGQRRISIPIPPTLRQGSAVVLGTSVVPTMVAAVQGPDRRVIACQETRLTSAGRKSSLSIPRKNFGKLQAGAVRLGPAAAVLGIAEGVESALAAQELFNLPVWAALGGDRVGKVELPNVVEQVYIFADNDDAGRRAADRAADAYRAQGRVVEIRLPPAEGADWNDELRRRSGARA